MNRELRRAAGFWAGWGVSAAAGVALGLWGLTQLVGQDVAVTLLGVTVCVAMAAAKVSMEVH
jgi:hypothetical protein